MGMERYTRRRGLFGAFGVGASGTLVRGIQTGTITVDFPSINATSKGTKDCTITGVAAGDIVLLEPASDVEDDILVLGGLAGTDKVTVVAYNPTGGGIDPASKTYRYLWIDLT